MRVPITYIASSGNEYNLISNGILHKDANYWKWSWGAEGTKLQYGFRIADFSRDAAVYDTELYFYGPVTSRRELISTLHDDFENDVRMKSPGKLIWGDYYIDCYIMESSTEPTEAMSQTSNKIKIYAPYPFWLQDYFLSFPAQAVVSSEYLDYTYDYDYDYASPTVGERSIQRTFPFESDFKMTIFGPAVNPRITINGYTYLLYMTIEEGEYVVIDSRAKTIVLYGWGGEQTNAFDYRNKAQSIFQKLPGGNLSVSWDASFGFELTIYHERSEPRIEVST